MISNRNLISVTAVLAATALGLALFWQPVEPSHQRRLPQPAASPGAASTTPAAAGTAAVSPLKAAPTGGDFVLDTAQGPFSLQDQRGKVVLLTFGYTFCPDICPTALLALAEALKALNAAEQARVVTLFVSVDPKRDTVRQLADYVRFFHPSIIGATGAPALLTELAGRYGAHFSIQKAQGDSAHYVVDHTAQTYLIDTNGRLATTLPHAATTEQTVAALRALLNQ